MSVLIALAALAGLIIAAYRGYSIILFAPICAMGAVLLTDPAALAPAFSGVFMAKMVGFIQSYFPVFLLGALFGKVIELSGFARSIIEVIIRFCGADRAMLVIVVVSALLTYGGVSVFVVVFAVYPFAAEAFRMANIPKRLLPASIALGAFTFAIDALPGSPQIQNIIPTTFFGTTSWAAPVLGLSGAIFILAFGLIYLEWCRKRAAARGEGYGTNLRNEPETPKHSTLRYPIIAFFPLIIVGVVNFAMTQAIPAWYGTNYSLLLPGMASPISIAVGPNIGIWAVITALIAGILFVLLFAWKNVISGFAENSKVAVGGAMLATMNTASEFGFGAIIASLPGFAVIATALQSIPNPLVNLAFTINILSGITGSASGGLSIALGAMAEQFVQTANAHGIPLEVLHRVAAMAAGGMDTLPHNGAVITLLAVTGLTHRESYKEIFMMTLMKFVASFFVIGLFYLTGWV